MHVLEWVHTRKKVLVRREFKTAGVALLIVLQVRAVYPGHPFRLDGRPV